jgi:hypothetical protein
MDKDEDEEGGGEWDEQLAELIDYAAGGSGQAAAAVQSITRDLAALVDLYRRVTESLRAGGEDARLVAVDRMLSDCEARLSSIRRRAAGGAFGER